MESSVRESRIKSRIKHFLPFAVQKFIYDNIVKKARLLKIQLQGKITKEDIKRQLANAGLKKGDAVIVHSSLSRIGYIDGGAKALIGAFIEVVGSNGLLVMPAFSALHYDKKKKMYVFDVKNTPCYTGSVPETFRHMRNVFRSVSPTHSLIAYGKKAKWFTGGHEKCSNPYAGKSPFYRLYQLDAKIFLIGVDQLANSSIHIVEDKYKRFPFKVWTKPNKVLATFSDGSKKIIHARWHLPNLYRIRDNNMLEKHFLGENLMNIYQFFGTELRVIKARDVADCMERLAKKNITIYTHRQK